MTPADAALLAQLLAARLPRGERCGSCASFEPDADDARHGCCADAAELRRYADGVRAADGCVYWAPRDRLAYWW